MSHAQRTAVTNYRHRLQEKGLSRLEVQATASDAPLIRQLAMTLRGDPARAAQVRQELQRLVDNERPSRKELLASAPLEGIDLTRPSDFGRDDEI